MLPHEVRCSVMCGTHLV